MTPTETLARTIYAEARSDGERGMTAVACVVLNRVAHPTWWGRSIETVCRAPAQFSCWNGGDKNYAAMLSVTTADKSYMLALEIAAKAVADKLADIVLGATTYKVTSLPWPKSWGAQVAPLITVGHQTFYALPQRIQPTQKLAA